MVKGLKSHVTGAIWDVDVASLPAWAGWFVRLVRILYAVVRDLGDGMLSLRAMSLVYATLLSLVPLLAISFSVLKGLGVHYDQLEPRLLDFLAPLGEKGVEITEYIIAFVERVEVGVLGAVGLGFLVYTVVSLMQKIERSFNDTWQVTRHRPFAQRFSGYLIVLLIGPVLVFSSMGITASVMGSDAVAALTAIQPLGALVKLAGKLVPYFLIIAAFTSIYVFLPNTRVRVRSALVGAAVAGFLWETAGWAFASFILGSTKYTVVYSAFASLILFMIWLYLSWLILLVGASIAFYHQHPEFLTVRRGELRMSNRLRAKLALLAEYDVDITVVAKSTLELFEIEAEAFIGSDTMLVAPVTVGRGAATGAGSVVTRDVERGTTVTGVPARLHKGKKVSKGGDGKQRRPSGE